MSKERFMSKEIRTIMDKIPCELVSDKSISYEIEQFIDDEELKFKEEKFKYEYNNDMRMFRFCLSNAFHRKSNYRNIKARIRTYKEYHEYIKNKVSENVSEFEKQGLYVSYIFFTTSLIESITSRIILDNFIKQPCQTENTRKLIKYMGESSRRDILEKNGIITSKFAGKMKSLYNKRNKIGHDYRIRASNQYLVTYSDKVVKECYKIINKLKRFVGMGWEKLWEKSKKYRTIVREKAIEETVEKFKCENKEINIFNSENIEIKKLKWEKNPFTICTHSHHKFNINAGVKDFSNMSKEDYNKLMTFINVVCDKINNINKKTKPLRIKDFDYFIYVCHVTLNQDEITDILPSKRNYLEKKYLNIKSNVENAEMRTSTQCNLF